MSNRALRGTKRRCQSEECGLPFYDLNRLDPSCPNCGVVYVPVQVREKPASAMRPAPFQNRAKKLIPLPAEAGVNDDPSAEPIEADLEVSADDLEEVEAEDIGSAAPDSILEEDEGAPDIDLDGPHVPIKED